MQSNGSKCLKVYGFSKEERLRRPEEFKRVRFCGRKAASDNFFVFYLQNGMSYSRIGIGVSKKMANAPRRNRIKRLVREFFRLNKHRIPSGYDFLILPKKDLLGLRYQDVEQELGELLIGKFH